MSYKSVISVTALLSIAMTIYIISYNNRENRISSLESNIDTNFYAIVPPMDTFVVAFPVHNLWRNNVRVSSIERCCNVASATIGSSIDALGFKNMFVSIVADPREGNHDVSIAVRTLEPDRISVFNIEYYVDKNSSNKDTLWAGPRDFPRERMWNNTTNIQF